jgi:signal transduction histidine kinase
MRDIFKQTGSLQPKELEAIYAISRSVTDATDTEIALDEMIRYLRPVFIFDCIVLYCMNPQGLLDPFYVRAIGRGRVREADLAWGETTAYKTYRSKQTTLRVERVEEKNSINFDRINNRHTLGLPCISGENMLGSLVFIRFGGPEYTPHQILLAEFVALHVAQLLHHQELVERIADLEAKRRLDSLQNEFVATITHELLTPLGFIKGYATTLLREDTSWDNQTRKEFLMIIDEEAERLRELIDNLLDSSRLQTGTLSMDFQPLRLDTLLKDISLRASTRNPDLQIDLNIKTPALQILADPTRLAQVFENIINNAIKYAPNSPLTITLEKRDTHVYISIQDFGPGIPKDQLEKIFQRFYRVPSQNTAVRGTGLGLFICRQIIQAHDGIIKAESREGKGATFNIYLPLEVKETVPIEVGE